MAKSEYKTVNVRPATYSRIVAITRLRGLVSVVNAMDVLTKEEAGRLVKPTAKRIKKEFTRALSFTRRSAAGGED